MIRIFEELVEAINLDWDQISRPGKVRIVNLTNFLPRVDLRFYYAAQLKPVLILILKNGHILHGIFVNNNNIIYINQYVCVVFDTI